MRLAFAIVLAAGVVGMAQEPPPPILPKEPDPRYGVNAKLKAYPQHTAKRALESAIEACEAGEYAYLLAHLLDPAFVDQRVNDRAKQHEAAAEAELTRLRDFQYANPDRFAPEDRLPLDRARFLPLVIAKSRERAFRQVARDVEAKMRDDPQSLKDLKKILRDGTFSDEAGTRAVHPTVKDKTLYFKKIGERWFLENRQSDETKKEP